MSETKDSYDLEKVYDEQIAPLMTKIIAVCNEHKMPIFATFQYAATEDDEFVCTTNSLHADTRRLGNIANLLATLNRSGSFAAFMITKGSK